MSLFDKWRRGKEPGGGPPEATFTLRLDVEYVERHPEAIGDLTGGTVFVPATTPPRAATPIVLELLILDDGPERHAAIVVWSRSGRGGSQGGFGAQLVEPSPALLQRLQAVPAAARREAEMFNSLLGITAQDDDQGIHAALKELVPASRINPAVADKAAPRTAKPVTPSPPPPPPAKAAAITPLPPFRPAPPAPAPAAPAPPPAAPAPPPAPSAAPWQNRTSVPPTRPVPVVVIDDGEDQIREDSVDDEQVEELRGAEALLASDAEELYLRDDLDALLARRQAEPTIVVEDSEPPSTAPPVEFGTPPLNIAPPTTSPAPVIPPAEVTSPLPPLPPPPPPVDTAALLATDSDIDVDQSAENAVKGGEATTPPPEDDTDDAIEVGDETNDPHDLERTDAPQPEEEPGESAALDSPDGEPTETALDLDGGPESTPTAPARTGLVDMLLPDDHQRAAISRPPADDVSVLNSLNEPRASEPVEETVAPLDAPPPEEPSAPPPSAPVTAEPAAVAEPTVEKAPDEKPPAAVPPALEVAPGPSELPTASSLPDVSERTPSPRFVPVVVLEPHEVVVADHAAHDGPDPLDLLAEDDALPTGATDVMADERAGSTDEPLTARSEQDEEPAGRHEDHAATEEAPGQDAQLGFPSESDAPEEQRAQQLFVFVQPYGRRPQLQARFVNARLFKAYWDCYLSHGLFFVQTDLAPPAGTRIDVFVSIPDEAEPLWSPAIVETPPPALGGRGCVARVSDPSGKFFGRLAAYSQAASIDRLDDLGAGPSDVDGAELGKSR